MKRLIILLTIAFFSACTIQLIVPKENPVTQEDTLPDVDTILDEDPERGGRVETDTIPDAYGNKKVDELSYLTTIADSIEFLTIHGATGSKEWKRFTAATVSNYIEAADSTDMVDSLSAHRTEIDAAFDSLAQHRIDIDAGGGGGGSQSVFKIMSDDFGFSTATADDPDDVLKFRSPDGSISFAAWDDDPTYGDYLAFEIAGNSVGSDEIKENAVGSNELTSTIVTPGTYTTATVTVDADGRITSAASGNAAIDNGELDELGAWSYHVAPDTTTSDAYDTASPYLAISIFSGFATHTDSMPATFRYAKIKAYPFDAGNLPTEFRLLFYDTLGGTIIADDTITISTPTVSEIIELEFDFDTLVTNTNTNTGRLWVGFVSNGYTGLVGHLDPSYMPTTANVGNYESGKVMYPPSWSQISGSINYGLAYKVWNEPYTKVLTWEYQDSAAIKMKDKMNDLSLLPTFNINIHLPDTIWFRNFVQSQIFYRSVIESATPYDYSPVIEGTMGSGWGPDKYPRYLNVVTPIAGLSKTLEFSLRDNEGATIGNNTAIAIASDNGSAPADTVKILFIGDSLTEDSTYVVEFQRMIAETGGSPSGIGYSKVKLIGTQNPGKTAHEGYSGRDWDWFYSDAASPFTFGGNADFGQYISNNSLGDVDYIYIFLGWNEMSGAATYYTISDWSAITSTVNAMLDSINADYPSAKIGLIGLQTPSPYGGLGLNYENDEKQPNLSNYHNLLRTSNAYNAALEAQANLRDYVSYIDTRVFFDAEYSYTETTYNVNIRNTTTETVQTNGVHPNEDGYETIADVILAHFLHYLQ